MLQRRTPGCSSSKGIGLLVAAACAVAPLIAGCVDGTTPDCAGAASMCGPILTDSGPTLDGAADADAGGSKADADAAAPSDGANDSAVDN